MCFYFPFQNALSLYKSSVKKLRFSGPTKLKPIISMAESLSVKEPTQNHQVYNILLVITVINWSVALKSEERFRQYIFMPMFAFVGFILKRIPLMHRKLFPITCLLRD